MLLRARDGKGSMGAAALEDYAYVAYGLARWAELSGTGPDKLLSQKLLVLAWQRFHSEAGWQATDLPPLPGMPLDQAQEDGALPSPAAVIIQLSLESGNQELREKALASRNKVLAAIQDKPFWYASHVRTLLD